MGDSDEIDQQRSRWLLYEIEPGTAAHRIAAMACFPGKPDIPALKYALHALADRHAALRVTFPPDGEPAKRAAMMAKACLRESDARGLDDEQFAKWLEYAAQEPFDLARGLRLRIHIYRTAVDETVVLVVAHHFIADVWLMMTLVRELETLYVERAGGMAAALPEPGAGNKELVRLYRWVGGRRAWVHAARAHGSGIRPAAC
jgi:hypothetical protein